MAYVDGFLIPVPKKNLAAYRRMARLAGKVWMEHGALDYKECVADALVSDTPQGEMPSLFPKCAQAKKGETVVLAFIVFKSKAQRDRVNRKVMEDPRLQEMMGGRKMPFDVQRMAYAGFKPIVDMGKA